MDLLALREHSACDLARKLERKGNDPELIREVVELLVEQRLVCDRRYAEAYVESRRRRGDGPRKIQQALRASGVSDDIAHECLQSEDEMWIHNARRVREKKFGLDSPEDMKTRAKQSRFLEQRGFTHSQIRAAFALIDDVPML